MTMLDVIEMTTLRIPGVLELVVDGETTYAGMKGHSTLALLMDLERTCDELRRALRARKSGSGHVYPSLSRRAEPSEDWRESSDGAETCSGACSDCQGIDLDGGNLAQGRP
jgi:hypothetical protein